jgi:hypothetical protein
MSGFQVPLQAHVIRPKLGKANYPRIEWIFRHIIGNTTIGSTSFVNKRFEMWKDLLHAVWRKSKYPNNNDSRLHLAFSCFNNVSISLPKAWDGRRFPASRKTSSR